MARGKRKGQDVTKPIPIPGLPLVPWETAQRRAVEIAKELERIPYDQWIIADHPKSYQIDVSGYGQLTVCIQIVERNPEYLQALVSVDSHTWTMGAGMQRGRIVGTTSPCISIVIPSDPSDTSKRIAG